jgi:hypothetical protein
LFALHRLVLETFPFLSRQKTNFAAIKISKPKIANHKINIE